MVRVDQGVVSMQHLIKSLEGQTCLVLEHQNWFVIVAHGYDIIAYHDYEPIVKWWVDCL